MTKNLFAACRTDNEGLVAKRVRVTQAVQNAIEKLFLEQEADFLRSITEEVEFNGAWKPDDNEMLTIALPEEAKVFTEAAAASPLSLPDLDAANFTDENVRALFVGDKKRVLIQRFAPPQVLSRRFSLLLDNNTFKRLDQPAFAFDTRLTCVISGGKIKFKSFHAIRQIVDLFDLYQEATDQGVADFAAKSIFDVTNVDQFKANADQTCRKLIFAIENDGVLDRHTAHKIAAAAKSVGLKVAVSKAKIKVPTDRAGLKQLLRFLDDGLYEASLSGQRYVTNSKKRLKGP